MPTTLVAPAKLTVSLRVVGRRPDGYHLLDAEMVSLDLADELSFADGDGIELVDGSVDVPLGDDNLVARALRAVRRAAHVRLLKRIPVGGGLGGGSTDAAAVLRWAAAHHGRAPDVGMAASLGADVAFCLAGGRARVEGTGEVLTPLPQVDRTFTLVLPPFGCSTAEVYKVWDELGSPVSDGPNDLETAALAVEPRLALWRDTLGDATGQTPLLAGSGSTWFVEGDFPGPDRLVVRTVPAYA